MKQSSPETARPALRVIHLTGGYRAYDLGEAEIRVGLDFQRCMLTIPNQPYDEVFAALESIGLQVIGADFISHPRQEMHLPPDFQTFTLHSGFAALWGERSWSDVKNVTTQRTPRILDISDRFATYHRLITLRLREMSESYRSALLSHSTDIDGKYKKPNAGDFFTNGFQIYIEAAIHAFLADGAAFRDLIAEATWQLILNNQNNDVTTFSALLKKTKNSKSSHPILSQLHQDGEKGGWVKNLTDLRNAVTHIAPLANTHELHSSQVRQQSLRDGSIPTLHYPLTMADGSLRPRAEPIDFDDHAGLKERFRIYAEFVNGSGDALIYASRCADQLIATATQVREAAGLTHKIRTITSADIAGPVRVHRSGG